MVWEGVESVRSHVKEEVESVGLSVEGGVCSWLSSSIFSFNLFMYVSYDLLPRSCLLGSFVTFCYVLSMFILSKMEKINKKINSNIIINQQTSFPTPASKTKAKDQKRVDAARRG